MPSAPERIRRIAFINFGGIGDEVLFAPVIDEVKKHLPQAHTTLFLEDRSRAVAELLDVASVIDLPVQGQTRTAMFFSLWTRLRQGKFDAVISSGSSPFIPVLLFLSGIPVRVGFGTGASSQMLLSVEAPLAPKHDRKGYAACMYFALAESFLRWLLKDGYSPTTPVLPRLKVLADEDRAWARDIIKTSGPDRKILIHPGVSAVSVKKNILKSWPPNAWADLIQQLTDAGHHVFLIGGPDDADAVAKILQALPGDIPRFSNLYGQTKNLRQLAALIAESDLLIGVDSSPMHIAVGYGKPAVTMFGPTDEKKLLPPGDPRYPSVTVPDLNCRPCLWDVRNESCDKPVCLNVPVSRMLEAISPLLR